MTGDKLRNRANAIDRPQKGRDLRSFEHPLPNNHICSTVNGSHDYKFLRGDRYGCCKKCGDEVLT